MKHLASLFLCSLTLASLPLNGAINVTIAEVGNDVVLSYEGSADLSGVSLDFTSSWNGTQNDIFASNGYFHNFTGVGYDRYVTNEAPTALGTSGSFSATAFAGDAFAIDNGMILFAKGYVSGTPLDGSLTFAGQTFDSMLLNQGAEYTVTWGAGANLDSATVTVVPEPATLALLAGAVAAGAIFWRRRRNA